MKIPYLDLSIREKNEREEYLKLFDSFLKAGRFVGGNALEIYKKSLSDYFNTNNINLCSSGTNALYLAGKACGIKSDDEVILPALSFYASANAFNELGAKCCFADILPNLTINPKSIEKLITKKTKAIVVVHFMGRSCNMDQILQLAKKYNLYVIEDASQAFGAKYNDKMVGTIGDIGCFSTNCMKILGGLGDSGFLISNNAKLTNSIDSLLYNGMNSLKQCVESSLNHRIDPIQCIFLNHRLKDVKTILEKRKEISQYYRSEISSYNLISSQEGDVDYGFTLLVNNRDDVIKELKEKGIETKIEHYPLMSELEIYKDCASDTRDAKIIAKKILNIPCHENLSNEEQQYTLKSVKEVLANVSN